MLKLTSNSFTVISTFAELAYSHEQLCATVSSYFIGSSSNDSFEIDLHGAENDQNYYHKFECAGHCLYKYSVNNLVKKTHNNEK